MDERTYQVFHQHMHDLQFFTDPGLAVWATRGHAKRHGYSAAELEAALAEAEHRKVDTSPMVHLSQRQLDALLQSSSLAGLPPELSDTSA